MRISTAARITLATLLVCALSSFTVISLAQVYIPLLAAEEPAPAPEEPAPTPEEPAPAPEEPAPTPEEPAPAPEEPAPAPEEPAPTPEEPAPAPEEPAPTPEEPAPAPEEPAPAPEEPAPTPEEPAPAPEEPAPTPEEPAPAPEEPALAPEEPIQAKPILIWHTNSPFHSLPIANVILGCDTNNSEALFEMGLRLYGSTTDKAEIKRAIGYIERAAYVGYPEAQLWVAEHYESGKSYPKNYRQSYLWCKKAADQEQPRAQYFLSLLYIAGRGVSGNSVQSAYWCSRSADNKYPPAMTRLGTLYQQGLGMPQSKREAIQWFLRGAMYNDSEAQYHLGLCYDKGDGVRENAVEAYKWMNISASQGNAQALSARQKIQKRLSQPQIQEGQELSLQFAQFIQSQRDPDDLDPLGASLPVENTISGFFITSDGHILTSWQPLANHTAIYARTAYGYFKAEIVLADTHNNLALLKIDNRIRSVLSDSLLAEDQPIPTIGPAIQPLALAPEAKFAMGDPVFTVGFPQYDRLSWLPKLSEGNIKGAAGVTGDPRFLKIGILINSQNTGAPIITASGEVVGILNIEDQRTGALFKTQKKNEVAYRNALRSQYAMPLFETLPEVKNKLKNPPEIKEQKFDASVAEATEAVVQIIIY